MKLKPLLFLTILALAGCGYNGYADPKARAMSLEMARCDSLLTIAAYRGDTDATKRLYFRRAQLDSEWKAFSK